MSRPSAIAAATATLCDLMARQLGLDVTALPPDKARDAAATETQLNVYLYRVVPDAAWKNSFAPFNSAGGSDVHVARLGLTLHYLLTAYGPTGRNDWESQRVLGEAMSLLNDQPLLDRKRIAAVSTNALRDAGLSEQAERVRFTAQPLSLDDMYKLWSGFQAPYRLSVAYEASVVLIDSVLPPPTARPILTRGRADRGPTVILGVPPRLDAIRFLHAPPMKTSRGDFMPAAVEVRENAPFDRIVLVGHNFGASDVTVEFRPAVGGGVIQRRGVVKGDTVEVEITPTHDGEPPWHPGFYTVSAVVQVPSGDDPNDRPTPLRSNALVVPVAPRFVIDPKPKVDGNALTLTCRIAPPIVVGQRLTAIVGRQSVSKVVDRALADSTSGVAFVLDRRGFTPGNTEVVRLRVDEVENLSFITETLPDNTVVARFATEPKVVIP